MIMIMKILKDLREDVLVLGVVFINEDLLGDICSHSSILYLIQLYCLLLS